MFGPALAWVKLYSHLIAAVAIAAAIIIGVWWVDNNGYNRAVAVVTAKWEAERAEIGRQSLKISEQAYRDTATLQINANKITGDKNAQIKTLNSELVTALDRLRNRPSSSGAGSLPKDANFGASIAGCTGVQLFRENSEVLTRLGRRADELRIHLKACYQQYDEAREMTTNPR